jgi:CYTH domain-containing protein
MYEMERRWKLKGQIPKDNIIRQMYIEQCYSNLKTPDVRIRKLVENDKESYFHTVKYKTDTKNSRIEIEQSIDKETYDEIFDIINKKPVKKNRYIVEISDEIYAEIDEFLDSNDIVVEVEFPDEEMMKNFEKPDWFGKEIKEKYSINHDVFSKINKTNFTWIDYLDKFNN